MIFNSTYTDPEKDLEVDKIIGKKFNLIESILLGGIGSKRLILESICGIINHFKLFKKSFAIL